MRIKAAAIRLNDGEIFTGATHFIAMEQIARAGFFKWPGITTAGTEEDTETFDPYEALESYAPEDGWLTDDGRFVGREEASSIAFQAGQTDTETGSLHSGDYPKLSETEEDDDPELAKELMGSRFSFETLGSSYNSTFVGVSLGGKHIGTLTKKKRHGKIEWFLSYVTRNKMHTHLPIAGPDEGAELLYQEAAGLTTIPQIKPPIEHIPPAPELESKVENLIDALSDADEPVDYSPHVIVSKSLADAGFEIIESTCNAGKLHVEFTWPTQSASTYVNGWRRAREVIAEHFELRDNNFKVQRFPQKTKAVLIENFNHNRPYGVSH